MKRRSTIFESEGFTLFELIVVLVILVLVTALVLPTVQRSFSSRRTVSAGEFVRTELNRARVAAMRTGQIHAFFYFPQSANYQIAPFNDEVVRLLRDSRNREDRRSSNFDFGDTQLPKGVLFVDGETLDDARSEQAFEDNSANVRDIQPVLFYPDGSSQSARLYLRSDTIDEDLVEINLRGMTGTSKLRTIDSLNQRGR